MSWSSIKTKASSAWQITKARARNVPLVVQHLGQEFSHNARMAGLAASSGYNYARNPSKNLVTNVSQNVGRVMFQNVSQVTKFAYNLGRAVGVSVNWLQNMGAFFVRGARTAISHFVSGLTKAGIKIYQMGYKIIQGIKGFLVRVGQSVKVGARKAATAIRTGDARIANNIREARETARIRKSSRRQAKHYQAQARSNTYQPKRTIPGRIISAVDNAFVRVADKIVPEDYGIKQNRYNSLRAVNKAKMARPRAVNRVASGLEAATASLAAAGIATGVTVAMSGTDDQEE